MKQKHIDALHSVVLHYHHEAKHDLIEYLEEEGYTHYGTDMEFSDLSSAELYDYCITQGISHIWVSLWELGELHEDTINEEPCLDKTIRELRNNPDFLCAEIFNIPDLLFHLSSALEDNYYNLDEVEEFVYDNKQFIIESIQKFTCDVYNYGSPFEEITNKIRKEIIERVETN